MVVKKETMTRRRKEIREKRIESFLLELVMKVWRVPVEKKEEIDDDNDKGIVAEGESTIA